MDKHIFTFGGGQQHAGFYQEIYAKDAETARQMMIEVYDNHWAFQYTEKEWEQSKLNGFFLNDEPLEPIYCEEEK